MRKILWVLTAVAAAATAAVFIASPRLATAQGGGKPVVHRQPRSEHRAGVQCQHALHRLAFLLDHELNQQHGYPHADCDDQGWRCL